MNGWWRGWVLVILVTPVLGGWSRIPEVRLTSLQLSRNSVTLAYSAELPNETILSIFVIAEPEFISHGREVRIVTQPENDPVAELRASVIDRRFTLKVDLKRGGYYRVNVVFNRLAQIYPAVLKTLGDLPDCTWPEALLLIDRGSLPAELADHSSHVQDWISKAEQMLRTIEQELESPQRWAERSRDVLKDLRRLVDQAKKDRRTTPYNASMDTIVQTLIKMNRFGPGVRKPNIKPGSAEEAMILGMTDDIPGELSDDFLKLQIRAYLARAGAAILRERMILPMRVLLTEWDTLLGRMKNAKAKDKEVQAIQKRFEEAIVACRGNIDLVRKEKEILERVGEDTLKRIEDLILLMLEFVRDTREERSAAAETTSDLDVREKEIRSAFSTLDRSLRMIPK